MESFGSKLFSKVILKAVYNNTLGVQKVNLSVILNLVQDLNILITWYIQILKGLSLNSRFKLP